MNIEQYLECREIIDYNEESIIELAKPKALVFVPFFLCLIPIYCSFQRSAHLL